VLVAISEQVVSIPFNCAGFDDRVVVFAVVIPANPKYDIPRVKWEFLYRKLLARYFSNVDCHLCLRNQELIAFRRRQANTGVWNGQARSMPEAETC
jgi:hypothetical protein